MGFFASSGILNQRGFFSAPVSAAPPPSGIPVASTNSIILTGNISLNGEIRQKTQNPFGSGFSGGPNVYYQIVEYYGGEYPSYDIIMFSSANQTGYSGGIGNDIELQANKWYWVGGGCGDGGCSIYIYAINTSSSQTAEFIPTSNWSSNITITAA